jgi:hypothetical protein
MLIFPQWLFLTSIEDRPNPLAPFPCREGGRANLLAGEGFGERSKLSITKAIFLPHGPRLRTDRKLEIVFSR